MNGSGPAGEVTMADVRRRLDRIAALLDRSNTEAARLGVEAVAARDARLPTDPAGSPSE